MNKKLLLLLLALCLNQSLSAKTLIVCNECDYQDVGQALEHSSPHDTIYIKKGNYQAKNIEIRHPLTLLGEEGTVLDGGHDSYILRLLADSITVQHLTLVNAGRSDTKDYAAIYSSGARYFYIAHNRIIDPFFGLLIEKSKQGTIEDNIISGVRRRQDDAGNGIHLWHCQNVTVRNNEIYAMRDGIYLEFVNESVIENNNSHDNVRYGLHFMFSNHDRYLGNTFQRNGAGVAVMFSKYIEMRSNLFKENWGTASYGLLLKEIYDAEVVANRFVENTIGIFIEGSTRINYVSNHLERNGWALKVSGGCFANAWKKNNFIGNSFDVSYNGKLNDNYFAGNYWETYSGYDLDKDGTGDVPHRPVKLFSYVVNKTPETVILLRSLFVDIINFSERVSPVFTPDNLVDVSPAMKQF